jgi:hypothetical protein
MRWNLRLWILQSIWWMSTWLLPGTRLFKNKCLRIESQSRKICYWLGRKTEIITIFCQDYTREASKNPTKESDSKGESIVEYKLGKITKGWGVHITNCITKFVCYS